MRTQVSRIMFWSRTLFLFFNWRDITFLVDDVIGLLIVELLQEELDEGSLPRS